MAAIRPTPEVPKNKLNLNLDLRVVCLVLLGVIILLLGLWRPWEVMANDSGRTVSVTGDATVTAEPDQYVFSPQYTVRNADKAAALAATSAKSAELIPALKALGVTDRQIKSDASGYQNYPYYYDDANDEYNYTLSLTVTVADRALADKIQTYLLTTAPTGPVTPYADFSDAKRRQVEAAARNQATKAARAKADQSAANLGFRVGSVKSVEDTGFGGGPVYATDARAASGSAAAAEALPIQPGENKLNYSVTVVYYVR